MELELIHDCLARFGRRKHRRFAIHLPARVTWSAGCWPAELINLSVTGAMVRISDDLPSTRDMLLQWQGFSAFGRIVWTEHGHVGVQFDETIGESVIKMTQIMAQLAQLPFRKK